MHAEPGVDKRDRSATPRRSPDDRRRRAPAGRRRISACNRDCREKGCAGRPASASAPSLCRGPLPNARGPAPDDRAKWRRAGWAAGRVVPAFAVDDVVQIAPLGEPEAAVERLSRLLGSFGQLVGRAASFACRHQFSSSRSALYHSALISTALPRRGVTTQSPTLASIQVNGRFGSPCDKQAVGRIDVDAEPRPPHMMFDDVAENGNEQPQRVHVGRSPGCSARRRERTTAWHRPCGRALGAALRGTGWGSGRRGRSGRRCGSGSPLRYSRPVMRVRPSRLIIVSRPQSVNQW